MLAALRNFFISFFLCLLVFGFVGYKYIWPTVSDMVDFTDKTTSAETPSDAESSTDTSGSEFVPDPNGRTMTVAFVCKNSSDEVCGVHFARSNEGTRRFTFCSIPVSTKVINSVGVEVPIDYYFEEATTAQIKSKLASLTGFDVDRVVVVDMPAAKQLVSKLSDPYFDVSRTIRYKNPIYAGTDYPAGSEPENYYITVSTSRCKLDEHLTDAILTGNITATGISVESVMGELYDSLFVQFMTNAGTKRNNAALSQLLNYVRTDITVSDIETYGDMFFTYDEYQNVTTVEYPMDWATAVKAFRQADGT